ncbi:MAG: IS66 family transposase [archaeon]
MSIEEENKKLKREIEELKKEIERLKKIEDEYEEHKHHCTIFDKPSFVKKDIRKRHKTPGQKLGHKGYSRYIPERIDFVRRLILECCPECQGTNLSNVQEVRERFVEDIPEPTNTIITKYEIERRYCRDCKKIVEAEVEDALPNSRFGLRVMLLVVFMKMGLALPSQKIIKMLEAQYNLTISDGEIYKILHQVTQAFGSHYNELHQKIRDAAVKHIDETGWRINGKNHWLWIFINKEIAIYLVRKQRGSSVPIKFLGNQKDKIIVNDRYNAYNVLAKKTKCKLQICWTHLLRNAKDLAEHYDEAKYICRQLKHIFKLANKYKHRVTEKQVNGLFHKMDLIAEKRYKHSEVRKFVKSVCKFHRENLFRFVTNPGIEATNNRAERGIRKAVIIRKISSGNRSRKGADIFGVLLSVVETLKLQGKNPLKEMKNIIQASET